MRFHLWPSGSGHLIIYYARRYQRCRETCCLHQQRGTELRWASGWLYRSRRNNLNTENGNGQWEEATGSLMEQWLTVGLVPGYKEGTAAVSFQGYWTPCRVTEPRVTKVSLQSYRSRMTKFLSKSYRSKSDKGPFSELQKQEWHRSLLRAMELNVKGICFQGYSWRSQNSPVQCCEREYRINKLFFDIAFSFIRC